MIHEVPGGNTYRQDADGKLFREHRDPFHPLHEGEWEQVDTDMPLLVGAGKCYVPIKPLATRACASIRELLWLSSWAGMTMMTSDPVEVYIAARPEEFLGRLDTEDQG